jgi:hypothetical protein
LDCAEEEVDIPRGERKAPLSPQEWHSFFDETGRITNERKLRKKIFYGVHRPPPWALAMLCTPPLANYNVSGDALLVLQGVDPSIRREVWKYLLRYYPFDSTEEDRLIIRQSKAYAQPFTPMNWGLLGLA